MPTEDLNIAPINEPFAGRSKRGTGLRTTSVFLMISSWETSMYGCTNGAYLGSFCNSVSVAWESLDHSTFSYLLSAVRTWRNSGLPCTMSPVIEVPSAYSNVNAPALVANHTQSPSTKPIILETCTGAFLTETHFHGKRNSRHTVRPDVADHCATTPDLSATVPMPVFYARRNPAKTATFCAASRRLLWMNS